jgi:hypothetical protein
MRAFLPRSTLLLMVLTSPRALLEAGRVLVQYARNGMVQRQVKYL